MRNFLTQCYCNYKGLFYWLNWISYISNVFLNPIITVVLYSILGRFALGADAANYYSLGIIMSQMTFLLISGITQTYAYDRSLGTLSFLYASPANRLANFLSRPVLHYPNGLLLAATGLITLRLVTDIDFSALNWTVLIISILVIAASICGLAQFLGVFSIIVRDWQYPMSLSVGIVFALSGIIIPIDVFPTPVQEICKLLPITNGLSALREGFNGASFSAVYLSMLREALTGIVYLGLGFLGFVIFEQVARRSGELEKETIS